MTIGPILVFFSWNSLGHNGLTSAIGIIINQQQFYR